MSKHGFRLLLGDEELLLPFVDFALFKGVTTEQLCDVKWPSLDHLYWPLLDVDCLSNRFVIPGVSHWYRRPCPTPTPKGNLRLNLCRPIDIAKGGARTASLDLKTPEWIRFQRGVKVRKWGRAHRIDTIKFEGDNRA